MDRQIIEISNNGFFLSLYRGFLVIENEKKQKQEIPLDNILQQGQDINITFSFF